MSGRGTSYGEKAVTAQWRSKDHCANIAGGQGFRSTVGRTQGHRNTAGGGTVPLVDL